MTDTGEDKWRSMWERNDRVGRAKAYFLLWSKAGLGVDARFDDLDTLRLVFSRECPVRLAQYKTRDDAAVVPVVPADKYEAYLAHTWYDADDCCWVSREWANDYYSLRTGPYFADLNGYARNITPAGRLGRTMVKFT